MIIEPKLSQISLLCGCAVFSFKVVEIAVIIQHAGDFVDGDFCFSDLYFSHQCTMDGAQCCSLC